MQYAQAHAHICSREETHASKQKRRKKAFYSVLLLFKQAIADGVFEGIHCDGYEITSAFYCFEILFGNLVGLRRTSTK